MKVYFNTKAFDCLPEKRNLNITGDYSEAELAVLGSKKINLPEFKRLRAIYRFGIGRENISDDLLKKVIPAVFFPSEKAKEILYESTANFTVFLIFHMYYSNTIGLIDGWKKYTRDLLLKKHLLVVGLGNIGSRVARKMGQFTDVSAYDVKYNKEDELRPLIESADIVTLHIPLSEETRNFISAQELSWMKDDTILINTARGALVDEEALHQRITTTNLRAAFDVFWEEPYNGNLKSLGKSRFFMTPHSSSQTIDFVREGFNDITNIIKKFRGKE